ncbi:MAG: DeoR/GlpR transcriptional regulator [Chloroflexi bacterium]|nr:DeoR/GlpR transcriptional regulator [Chloroflexota bacterium]
MHASFRRQLILDRIKEDGRVQVAELSQTLGVSRMTIHRDLSRLAEEGLVRRVRGGAEALTEPGDLLGGGRCPMCSMRVRQRTAFIVQCAEGAQLRACCPHCGLLLLDSRPSAVSALAADFLHGRMINVRTATFLVEPNLTVCCTPSVLCFQQREDAIRFQKGFGGWVMDLFQAQAHLRGVMRLKTMMDEP